jgi:hypothetical protein
MSSTLSSCISPGEPRRKEGTMKILMVLGAALISILLVYAALEVTTDLITICNDGDTEVLSLAGKRTGLVKDMITCLADLDVNPAVSVGT